MAIGCMTALQDHGLNVLGDISVVGFDDIPFAGYARPVSLWKISYAKLVIAGIAL